MILPRFCPECFKDLLVFHFNPGRRMCKVCERNAKDRENGYPPLEPIVENKPHCPIGTEAYFKEWNRLNPIVPILGAGTYTKNNRGHYHDL